jgi:hypothetical protein
LLLRVNDIARKWWDDAGVRNSDGNLGEMDRRPTIVNHQNRGLAGECGEEAAGREPARSSGGMSAFFTSRCRLRRDHPPRYRVEHDAGPSGSGRAGILSNRGCGRMPRAQQLSIPSSRGASRDLQPKRPRFPLPACAGTSFAGITTEVAAPNPSRPSREPYSGPLAPDAVGSGRHVVSRHLS